MFAVNYRELRQMYESLGAQGACEQVAEWFDLTQRGEPGGLRPEEFSLREMAEALVENGREWVGRMDPRGAVNVMETGDAVDSTAFSNITGQVVYSMVLGTYMRPEYTFSRLIPTQSTRLDGEKIPGVENLKDDVDDTIHEGMPYPQTSFGEDYVTTPSTEKRGRIVAVTREAIFFDRINMVARQAGTVGDILASRKEKRLVDMAIGAKNSYSRQGTTYNTYQASSPWINDHANNFVDWTDIDKATDLLVDMVDPNTGEPILITPRQIVCMPQQMNTVRRTLNATEIRSTANSVETLSANPVAGQYELSASTLAYHRLQSELSVSQTNAKEYWFIGDFGKAFAYMENWPLTVTQAPPNSTAEFERDVVLQFKASERGIPAVMDPRYVVRNKNE